MEYESDEESDSEEDENETSESSRVKGKDEVREKYSMELRHLVAINDHELKLSGNQSERTWTIDSEVGSRVNEDELKNKTAEICNELVSCLFSLPTEARTDVGILATLPKTTNILTLPRQLPLPNPKQKTKWEKFAK